MSQKRHYFRMAGRVIRLMLGGDESSRYVTQSYDRISAGYDRAWTTHMRDMTEALIRRMNVPKGAAAVDLGCGTGFATGLLAELTEGRAVGVDRSAGMLEEARRNHGGRCEFIESDILEYLKTLPSGSLDIVTCCWALGYSRPFAVLRQIGRVLKPRGRAAMIDNSLFSLREVLYSSFMTFAEQPEKLAHLMKFRFLPGPRSLRLGMRLAGLKTIHCGRGNRTYIVRSGREAVERLRATGAAAGFEYAAGENGEELFTRFAEILQERYGTDVGVPIVHRCIEAIAQK